MEISILVVGDSLAGKGRFDPVAEPFRKQGVEAKVTSISFPGHSAQHIAKVIPRLLPAGAPDVLLIVAGTNDVLKRTGPSRYARGVRHIAQIVGARRCFALEVLSFDENVRLPTARQSLARFVRTVRDPHGNRVQRYRAALDGIEVIPSGLHTPDSFLDGIHLKPTEFEALALRAGQQIWERLVSHAGVISSSTCPAGNGSERSLLR